MWSTWLLFTMVSQAFSGLWWFNSCCYKHLLPALSRSQLRLTQPGTPYMLQLFFIFFFYAFFSPLYFEHAKWGKEAKRSDKPHSKSTLHGRDRDVEKRLEVLARVFKKRGILANPGSTFKKIRKKKKKRTKQQQQTSTSSSLKPSLICLFPVFFEKAPKRKRQRRRRSECWYDYVNVNRISCRLEAVFLSDPFSLQIFHLRRIPPGRLLRRYLTG